MRTSIGLALALSLVVAACGGDDGASSGTGSTTAATTATLPGETSSTVPAPLLDSDGEPIPPAPPVPDGPLAPSLVDDLDLVFGDLTVGVDFEALEKVGDSGDPRVAWLLADLLRFFQTGLISDAVLDSFERLTGTTIDNRYNRWGVATDRLIAWDIPAPPGYVEWKRRPFEIIEPAWAAFFADEDADVDWRHLSWGGVLIDDRPFDAVREPCPEGCIPALNDPGLVDVVRGDWYEDDGIVFGVVVNGEARAYPRHIMEVHEMVNDTLGGRRIGIPYCTLCGSAQAYFTDDVPDGFETIELRTSGLLSRSNKVMFDFNTFSMFDTFRGTALSGPLQDAGFRLEMITVVTSTWGDWKATHPDTTIVSAGGGIGRTYPRDPLRGRDDDGPIFPIGDVDLRLPVQEPVLGVTTPGGVAVAFPVAAARAALEAGEPVALEGVRVTTDGAGLIAETEQGEPIPSHQAFWFAWSQFNPTTVVWTPLSG